MYRTNNPYIQFVKQHPRLAGETAQQRISRVASLWRQVRQRSQQAAGGMYYGYRPTTSPY